MGEERYPVYQRVSECLSVSLATVKRVVAQDRSYNEVEDEDDIEPCIKKLKTTGRIKS